MPYRGEDDRRGSPVRRKRSFIRCAARSCDKNGNKNRSRVAKPDGIGNKVSRLDAYYGSFEWKIDFQSDEVGILPRDLKRGVLSEDGIYDLVERYRVLTGRSNG
ncbi:MAG: DUF4298 domain-containing protein [Clostridia bacterium]|nr:DUF4298 domain-containing protein [Clostridia bacterium]